jgi:hypothetical protein
LGNTPSRNLEKYPYIVIKKAMSANLGGVSARKKRGNKIVNI